MAYTTTYLTDRPFTVAKVKRSPVNKKISLFQIHKGHGVCKLMLSPEIAGAFEAHAAELKRDVVSRRENSSAKNVVETFEVNLLQDQKKTKTLNDNTEGLGTPSEDDEYRGDTRWRTMMTLFGMVDTRGFERSQNQVQFHEAFLTACARVIFKEDWGLQSPVIMKKMGWKRKFSEVMISTPRRFGKTFSVAIFVAVIALSMSLEVVIFSPARRASRKLLERVVEFIRLLDAEKRIVEYNQEVCRIKSYEQGEKTSLIRSFPSKVGVSYAFESNPTV